MKTTSFIFAALVLAPAARVWAQAGGPETGGPPRYVNLETDTVQPKGGFGLTSEVRGFGGHEDLNYVGIGARVGMGHGLEGALRGVFAQRRNTTTTSGAMIRHGGSDFEALLKYHPNGTARIAAMIGVSAPNTPAQSDGILVLGGAATHALSESLEVGINPRALFIEDNTIVGLGLGACAKLGKGMTVAAEYTPILSGNNTRSTATGALMRRDLYGVAIHFMAGNGRTDLSIGYTNAIGMTTGFGLTPGLGGSGAFYLGVAMRR